MYIYLAIIATLSLFSASSYAEPVEFTDCDVLAAHPSDPDKITQGVDDDVMLVPAIAACKDAVSNDPNNRRLRYQLGRVLFYSGQTQEAWSHLEYAAENGSSQAQFVVGYIIDGGYGGVDKDSCRTADLWKKSADQGRLAAMVSYPRHYIEGKLDGCPNLATINEMRFYIVSANKRVYADESPPSFYQRLVVTELEKDFAAFLGK